jgi:hypothetical protein
MLHTVSDLRPLLQQPLYLGIKLKRGTFTTAKEDSKFCLHRHEHGHPIDTLANQFLLQRTPCAATATTAPPGLVFVGPEPMVQRHSLEEAVIWGRFKSL